MFELLFTLLLLMDPPPAAPRIGGGDERTTRFEVGLSPAVHPVAVVVVVAQVMRTVLIFSIVARQVTHFFMMMAQAAQAQTQPQGLKITEARRSEQTKHSSSCGEKGKYWILMSYAI